MSDTKSRFRVLTDRQGRAAGPARPSGSGTAARDAVPAYLLTVADAEGKIDWDVSVDASITRAHQHATNTTRPEQDTGGTGRSQESPTGTD